MSKNNSNNNNKYRNVQTQKTISNKNPIVTGTETWINQQTGEIADATTILQKVQDINFTKVWISHLLNALDIVGGKKMKVVNYILDKMNYTENVLVATQAEIAEATNVSRKTVNETINLLKEAEFIKGRVGAIMLDPNVLAKGSAGKRQYLLMKFETFETNEKTEEQTPDNE